MQSGIVTSRSQVRQALREQLERSVQTDWDELSLDAVADELLNALTRPELAFSLRVLAARHPVEAQP
jgi:hypothetical protein